MSLRDYAGQYAVDIPSATRSAEVTVAFAFDRGYLPLFHVAASSLARSGNFLDSEVVIYTDDTAVTEDPLVRSVADRVTVLTGSKKETLHGLAQHSIRRSEREAWNKGTFLKWMVFEEQQNPTTVFLDVDMIFLRRFDARLLEDSTADFNACPQFMYRLLKDKQGEHLPLEKKWRIIEKALAADYSGRLSRRINSGVMVLREPLLSEEFFEEITAFAAERQQINEQGHFSEYFKLHAERRTMLPYGYNYQDEFIGALKDWEEQRKLLEKISVIHYAGSPKPWQKTLGPEARPTSSLWHWHATQSGADVRELMGVQPVG